ncbi:hypothetical protein [Phenylobacterium sp. J367]|uniref:hypothetical protein n=1 Tax=Phenylobacterium sp. J367 TaxID=2898435 RepID=UPI002151BFEA|nr:hypothetical protein [Phenylobacterium sp. J367]MCR5876960.1 hypothetical protein [Phenylobacterium sp. J367]MCR5877028.1 hypothetical protein [Phenylobacterium sp. J367]
MGAITSLLMDEAAALLREARQERDSARQEAADLREALRLAQITPESLLRRVRLDGLPDSARLLVKAQNPADNHHWSRSVSEIITAGEIRAALSKAEA